MENIHPIPQNVTSFQFKLVGDMTLKQFGYLAAGSGTAYLIFVFFAYDYPLVAWPIIIIFAILGVSFAFLGVASRPLDHWLVAFLKAIYSPTYRVWSKSGKTFKQDPLFSSRLMMYLSQGQAQQPTTIEPNLATTATLAATSAEEPPLGTLQKTEDTASLPTQEQLQKTVDLARQAQKLQIKIIQTERTLAQIKDQAEKPTPIPINYTQEVNKILADLQSLINQASLIKQQIQSVVKPQPKTEVITPQPTREKVKVVIPTQPKKTRVALTIFPNVINGIVKDKNNNYLEGVVAVIYDKEGLPVRALKTNKLGQFTGSTPLPNGTYTLELEEEGLTFDVLQIELTGGVLPPLLITAKE